MSQIIFSDADFSSNKLINLPDLEGLITWTYLGNGTNDNIDVYNNTEYSNVNFNGSSTGPVYTQGYGSFQSNTMITGALMSTQGDTNNNFSVMLVIQYPETIQNFYAWSMRGKNGGGTYMRASANATEGSIHIVSTTHGTASLGFGAPWNNKWKYIAATYNSSTNTSIIYNITDGTSNTLTSVGRLQANDAAILLGTALTGNVNGDFATTGGISSLARGGNIAFYALGSEVYSEAQFQSLEPFLQYYLGTRGVTLL